jgi:hypothetical protein
MLETIVESGFIFKVSRLRQFILSRSQSMPEPVNEVNGEGCAQTLAFFELSHLAISNPPFSASHETTSLATSLTLTYLPPSFLHSEPQSFLPSALPS